MNEQSSTQNSPTLSNFKCNHEIARTNGTEWKLMSIRPEMWLNRVVKIIFCRVLSNQIWKKNYAAYNITRFGLHFWTRERKNKEALNGNFCTRIIRKFWPATQKTRTAKGNFCRFISVICENCVINTCCLFP